MGTTPLGYTYPEDTDPVAAGAQNIKALALSVDSRLGVHAAGSLSVPINNSATGSAVVTLPAGRFTAAPVLAVASLNSSYLVAPSSKTATSFTMFARHYAAAVGTTSIPADWHATQI
jgi:hypothetical protein